MKRTLIYIDDLSIKYLSSLLGAAKKLNKGCDYELYAFDVMEDKFYEYEHFDYHIKLTHANIQYFDTVNITNCIEELNGIYRFDHILILANYFGRMLAPRLAMRLNVGLVADVTEINHTEGETLLIRPAFDGKLLAGIEIKGPKPLMATIRENVFSFDKTKRDTEVKTIEFTPKNIEKSSIKLIDVKEKPPISDIRESKILVSGGGGIIDDFDSLQSLAHELKAMVSASRKLVDNEVAGRNIQVGQSGKTVSPKLYLALGIYGSLQHIEGLKNVEYIISVNKNKDAPICSLSDIVVVGDATEFVKKMVMKIQKSKSIDK